MKIDAPVHSEECVELDSRLERDAGPLGRFTLCRLLMMRDSNYPWFLLVPDREGVREIHELCRDDQIHLIDESSALAGALERTFSPDKLNIAALGNVVPQLHIHHIVRYKADRAWPDPVWGRVPAAPFEPGAWIQRARLMHSALASAATFVPDALEEAGR